MSYRKFLRHISSCFTTITVCTMMILSCTGCGREIPIFPENAEDEASTGLVPQSPYTKDTTADIKSDIDNLQRANASTDINSDGSINFIMAEMVAPDTISGQVDQVFCDKVKELSNGEITIELHTSGELGDENDIIDSMISNTTDIDFCRISASYLTNYGGKQSALLSLPYTFKNRDHFWKFAKSDLAKQILEEPSNNGFGVRGLFLGEEGFRNFFSNKPISGIEDLHKLKIRVASDPIMSDLVESLGGEPTVIKFEDMVDAFENGTIDVAEQPIVNYESNGFSKVADTMILDGHTLGAIQIIMTDNAWNSLTEVQQGYIQAAADYTAEFNRNLSEFTESETIKLLEHTGCKIIPVEDKEPYRKAAVDVITDNTKGYEYIYQQILSYGE